MDNSKPKSKEKLPNEGVLEIIFNEDGFRLVERNICTKLDVEVFTSLPSGTRVKFSIRITQVFSPEEMGGHITSRLDSTNDTDVARASGYVRAQGIIANKLLEKTWFLCGVTNDKWEIPICVMIIPEVISSYTFKRNEESIQKFNPSLN